MGHLRVTIGHLRATMGHLRLTIGYLKATVVHIRITLGHLKVTIGYFFSISKYKANTTELHLKVRQTCQFLASNSFVNITLIIPHSTSEEAVSTHRQLRPGERLLAGEGGRGRARPRRRVTS